MIYLIINMSMILLCYIYYYKEKDRIINRYIQKRKKQIDQELKESVAERLKHCEELDKELECRSRALQETEEQLRETENRYCHLTEKMQNYEEVQKQSIDHYIQIIKEIKTNEAMFQLEQEFEKRRQNEEEKQKQILLSYDSIRKEQQSEIDILSKQLDNFRAKQEAINQEILRRRAIEEEQNFYKICLSNEAKSDINYLISIAPNLKNPTVLYKLIWSEYIQKQFNQMLKNILGATDPRNVIYSITNLKTNEIYIGKTKAEVSKRWTEHVKSSLNIGTIKSAKIHEALYNHWDEFVFAIIEKVPLEESLSEREKFYIDFYQSNIYGYNLKSGG